MSIKPRLIISTLTILLYLSPCAAIVNMENLHLGNSQPGFVGQFKISASGASGNTDKSQTSIGTSLQWHAQKRAEFLIFDYTYGENEGSTNTNKGFLHARQQYHYQTQHSWELFSQIQHNEFTRLSLRSLIGTGNRMRLSTLSEQKIIFFGSGLFYENEKLEASINTTDDTSTTSWRANLYLIFKQKLNDTVSFQNSTYYQPDPTEFNDYRLIDNASLNIKLNKNLNFEVTLNVSHDARPPQNVDETDVNYRTGLNYQF